MMLSHGVNDDILFTADSIIKLKRGKVNIYYA